MKTYYVYKCVKCEPTRVLPFEDQEKRDEHAAAHILATGHFVTVYEEKTR